MTSDPQQAWLQDHIHLAWCGADIVVLDVRSDDYALLLDMADIVRPSGVPGGVIAEPDIVTELASIGLVALAPSSPPRRALPKRRGQITADPHPANLLGLGDAVLNGLRATAAFHRKDMAELIESARRRGRRERRIPAEAIARAALAFETALPWIPFEGDCLQRGFMLHRHLRRAGIPAQWVFGVRTWPFLAHCWVQVGDQVIGDSLERTASFTAIMAV